MAGANIALSVVFLQALRRFGLGVSRDEGEALLAMWRYSSHLMGIVPELQCSTEAEGWHLVASMTATCVDLDEEALLAGARRAEAAGLGERITFVHGAVVPGLGNAPALMPHDVVYAIGLCETLDDEQLVGWLGLAWTMLRPGGLVVLTHLAQGNPDGGSGNGKPRSNCHRSPLQDRRTETSQPASRIPCVAARSSRQSTATATAPSRCSRVSGWSSILIVDARNRSHQSGSSLRGLVDTFAQFVAAAKTEANDTEQSRLLEETLVADLAAVAREIDATGAIDADKPTSC